MSSFEKLGAQDREVYEAIINELKRQREGLEMIPSENFTSQAVLEAMGSILTNKYSEGYPAHRYYGGNQFIDVVEKAAQDRAKALFKVPHVNVQPYSGSPANLAIYMAVCKPGDTIMGQNLPDGGHLTHGFKTSLTGQIFNSVPYHVKADGYLDVEEAARLAKEHKPKLIWIGATAYTRPLPFKEFAEIAEECGAYLAADISHISGLIAAGAHESPVDYVDIVMTTTHKTLRGPRGAMIMVTEKGLKKDPDLASKIDKTIFPGMQGGPHNHITAGIAIALAEASTPEFREYGRQIVTNARSLGESLKRRNVKLVTGGTDNHMLLIDLIPFGNGLGVFVQDALDQANITVNKNTIPKDPAPPFYPSGIRLGTPALTTRGMKEAEMDEIGGLIADVIEETMRVLPSKQLPEDKETRQAMIRAFKEQLPANQKLAEVRQKVIKLCERFPLYPGMAEEPTGKP